jgi:hypothetical protein
MKGFRERSLLFLSSAIVRRNNFAVRISESRENSAPAIGLKVLPLLERGAFTIPSVGCLWGVESSEPLVASVLEDKIGKTSAGYFSFSLLA